MIGIYNNVWISPYNMEYITEFQIEKKMNAHDTACIKGIISATSLMMYQNMIDGKTIVSVYFEQEKKTQLLFSGYIERIDVTEVGENREATMQLKGLTEALDRAVAFADYQYEKKVNQDMIEELMKSYPDISYKMSCKKETIKDFMLQYDETDYEFIKRLLSRIEEPIYTTTLGQFGQIQFGFEARSTDIVLDEIEYEMFYEDGMQYVLVHDEYLDLGMQVMLDGQSLIVRRAKYQFINGNSENEYQLGPEASCVMKPVKNEKVTGISLDGSIVDCKRNKVKVELKKTFPCPEEKRKWFAYSSPAASTDGSGWYCMPKNGEEIRLYCPTNDESDAYVISAIREKQSDSEQGQGGNAAQSGGGAQAGAGSQSAGSKPENKVLSNEEGQTVSFLPEGIKMSCKDGNTIMSLNSDGTIEIEALKDVNIYGDNTIMMRAEQGMCIKATGTITLTNDTGSTLVIDSTITEEANRIKNNC